MASVMRILSKAEMPREILVTTRRESLVAMKVMHVFGKEDVRGGKASQQSEQYSEEEKFRLLLYDL